MEKEKRTFTLDEGCKLEDIGADYGLVTTPCNLCIHEDRCLGTSSEDEVICDVAGSFEKLFDEFNEKAFKLVKDLGRA